MRRIYRQRDDFKVYFNNRQVKLCSKFFNSNEIHLKFNNSTSHLTYSNNNKKLIGTTR